MNGVLYFETRSCSVAGLSGCFLAVFQFYSKVFAAHMMGFPSRMAVLASGYLRSPLSSCFFPCLIFARTVQSYHDHLGYSPIKNGFSSEMFSFGISGQSSSSHFRSRGYPRLTMSRFMALSDHGIFRVQKC